MAKKTIHTQLITALTYLCRLSDTITYLSDLIEGSVGAQGEVRPGHVVADGGGDHHERDAELRELLAGFIYLQTRLVCLENVIILLFIVECGNHFSYGSKKSL